jgi:hypothetical protein
MFGLFKKKPTQSESMARISALASAADIHPIINGELVSFLIQTNVLSPELATYFEYRGTLETFTSIIEKRISAADYVKHVDPDPFFEKTINESRRRMPTNVPRIAVDASNKGLFRWDPPIAN